MGLEDFEKLKEKAKKLGSSLKEYIKGLNLNKPISCLL